ncbi:MAG: hypothetical protein OXN18_05355 [Gemmatimonadota bacterium]|nr:hypothetical protein [Gemmatimonadota bacterium]
MGHRIPPLVLLATLLAVFPSGAGAQSFLGYRALGLPVGAVEARAVALGNLGIGLPGVQINASDPASAAGVLFPTVSVSMQPTWGDFNLDGQTGTARTTRFPMLGIGYPVLSADGTITVSLSGHMEQRWAGERDRIVNLGGIDVPVNDRFETNGGSSVARVGWAQRLGDRFALGASLGTYIGRLDEDFERTLDSLVVGNDVRSYEENSSWRYGGYTFSAGFMADPHDLIHLAGAVEWSGDLTQKPRVATGEPGLSYSIPLRLSGGATGRLSQRLHINTSFVYQDWSVAQGFEDGVVSDEKLSYGAGLEMQLIRRETRSFPLRLGYRRSALPFGYRDQGAIETSWSLGLGVNLVEVEGVRFGWMDFAAERGTRMSAPLSENFWRATISLGISSS